MNYDELAFANQQLAGMLQTGVPLEGALKQLCATMRHGTLRAEFERLEADLAQGTPLPEAMARRSLPAFYVAMVRVGVQSHDLAGVFTLLADYYHQANAAWVRLKGLMLYPLIVLTAAFGLSLALSIIFGRVTQQVSEAGFGADVGQRLWITVWIAPVLLGGLVVVLTAALLTPSWRARLRWRLPGFREASLAQMASSLSILLGRGCSLNDALDLMCRIEGGSVAGVELARWRERLSQGQGRVEDFAGDASTFPQLFIWLAANAGQDLAAGFRRAADLYQNRASHRIEMMLYACLPVSVLLLGMMILGQVYPLVRIFMIFNNALGNEGWGD